MFVGLCSLNVFIVDHAWYHLGSTVSTILISYPILYYFNSSYDGQYDDLLYYFAYQYDLVQQAMTERAALKRSTEDDKTDLDVSQQKRKRLKIN